jgi:hypothetical protein
VRVGKKESGKEGSVAVAVVESGERLGLVLPNEGDQISSAKSRCCRLRPLITVLTAPLPK